MADINPAMAYHEILHFTGKAKKKMKAINNANCVDSLVVIEFNMNDSKFYLYKNI